MSSFGFGGANVHAILESYGPGDLAPLPGTSSTVAVFTPFVFSAFSEASLIAYLERFHEYLQDHSDSVDLRDIAYTLHSRRTGFQVTTAIAASSVEDLSHKVATIKGAGKVADKPAIARIPRRGASQFEGPRFLGIFVSALSQGRGGINRMFANTDRLDKVPNLPAWALSC
jgi:acyl transferase domain-containing protein